MRHYQIAAAALLSVALVFSGQVSASADSKGGTGAYCAANYRVKVQGRSTGDTKHQVNLTVWHKGYKNNVTSTTYADTTGSFSWSFTAPIVVHNETDAQCTVR